MDKTYEAIEINQIICFKTFVNVRANVTFYYLNFSTIDKVR